MPTMHRVVQPAVGHAALHVVAGGLDDVEVRQGVAVGRDDDARAAAVSAVGENRDGGAGGFGDSGDAGLFGGQDRRGDVSRSGK